MAPAQPTVAFGEASYHHLFELAAGGMGRVELVVRSEGTFKRLYAVKRLHEGARDDEDVRQAFLDEARIAGLVRHPNVVSVLDVGEDARGPYLVMEYVEGVSVVTMLRRAQRAQRSLPLQVCLRTIIQAAEGLHAAHRLRAEDGTLLGLVHRDVSPPNILVGFDGVVRVTDFGVAKALGRMSQTQGDVLKGKLGYMSPEQLRFAPIDHRSDLFALGVVLFEMLSGRRLYANKKEMEGTRRLLEAPPPDLADVRDDAPPALVQLMFSMLAKDPAHRPSSAIEVRRRLEEILAECVAVEGPLELSEHLRETLADVERSNAERIAQALEAVDDKARAPTVDSKPPRWPAALAGAALVALVGWATAIAFATDPAAEDGEAIVRVREAEDDRAEVEAEEAPTTVDAPDAGPAAREPPREAPEPRRAKKRRRGTKRREKRDGVPMWEWD